MFIVKEDLYLFKYPKSILFEYVGSKFGFPLKIFIGLTLVGKGLINLDQGLLILLFYPKVSVSSSEISNPKLNVGKSPESFLLIKS